MANPILRTFKRTPVIIGFFIICATISTALILLYISNSNPTDVSPNPKDTSPESAISAPLYPGAESVAYDSYFDAPSDLSWKHVSFTTEDTQERILAYYNEKFTKEGWKKTTHHLCNHRAQPILAGVEDILASATVSA